MYIYKTTCIVNGKIYVGQCNRKSSSTSYLGSGMIILNAIEKYGRKNFNKEILKSDLNSQKDLDIWEQIFIRKLNSTDPNIGYNILKGGQGDNPMSNPESREKVRQFQLGRKKTPEAIQKMSDSGKLKVMTPEHLNNLAEANRLRIKNSEPWNKGIKWSDEQKQRLNDSKGDKMKGENHPQFGKRWKWTEEQRQNLRNIKSQKNV